MVNYTIKNIKKINWGVLEKNNPISLYPVMYPGWSGIIKNTGRVLGMYQKNIICFHQKKSGVIFIDHDEWNNLGEYTLKKVIDNPDWALKINNQIIDNSDDLVDFTRKNIFEKNLNQKSNQDLYRLYENYLEKHSKLYNIAIIPVYLDLYKPYLTNYLINYIGGRLKESGVKLTAKECFVKLTTSQKLSKIQEEEISLMKVATNVARKDFKGINGVDDLNHITRSMFDNHVEKFKYLGYNFEGPAFTTEYFWERFTKMFSKENIESEIKIIREKKQKDEIKRNNILAKINLDNKHKLLLELTRNFIYSKDYRKAAMVESYYMVEKLLKEIGVRTNLSINEVRNCLFKEIKEILIGRKKISHELKKRMKWCIFVVINKKLPGKVLTDERYEQIKKFLSKKEDYNEVNYFHGQVASLGKARGVVKIIKSVADISKMQKGNIMVAQMTNPDLLLAMKKSSAIITDLGGITCHAAIVSREINKPCIIGTKVATKILKDGDRVEVDANQGEVRKI